MREVPDVGPVAPVLPPRPVKRDDAEGRRRRPREDTPPERDQPSQDGGIDEYA